MLGPADSGWLQLAAMSTHQRRDVWNRLEQMDGQDEDGDLEDNPLVHTPSVASDLARGFSAAAAARGQRLRQQIRIVDACIADAKAQLIRQRLLRGPSGRQFECDKDSIVGGCGETFAEEDGVLCATGCQLFLCHTCFGSRVVANECQVGGRYDASINATADSGVMSAPGSMPCPLYPSQCTCGHIPLADILRALLHDSNRGPDGGFEDIESPGLSAHKIFLIARRRQAEAQLARDTRNASPDTRRLREFKLVRTISGATSALDQALALGRSSSTYQSGARAALADKCDELEQLRSELLGAASDGEAAIPPALRRRCAQCAGEFSCFEGGQCTTVACDHFLCNVCFGGYLMQACSPGGAFERALTNRDGMIVSPAGKLPCPFFSGHEHQLTFGNLTGPPPLACRCGIIESSTIERVLMDPRNSSGPYWRERKASAAINAQATVDGLLPGDRATSGPWSWATEWLSRNWTPSAVHETARLRVSEEARRVEQENRVAGAKTSAEVDALAELSTRVVAALTEGSSIRCPSCGVHAVKDDACIHMDSCPCQAGSWCFLCGRLSGSAAGQCPRYPQPGGCDQQGLFLEQMQGWGEFALPGESPAYGAQQEFLRRRQACYVRRVMEETDPQLWKQLRDKSPGLLIDCPTPGRKIEWDDVASAEFPLFGGNLQRGVRDVEDLLARDGVNTPLNADAAARFEAHFRREQEIARDRQLAMRRLQRRSMARGFVFVGSIASIVYLLTLFPLFPLFRSGNPRHDLEPLVPNLTVAAGASSVGQADCTKPVEFLQLSMRVPCECGSLCYVLWLLPVVAMFSAFVGVVRVYAATHVGLFNELYLVCLLLFWSLDIGPLARAQISLFFNPICAGALGTAIVMSSVADVLHRSFARHTVNGICVLTCFLGYAAYLGVTIHARILYNGPLFTYDLSDSTVGRADDFKLSDYKCTTACWVVRCIVWTTAGLATPGLVTFARTGSYWMEDWTDDPPKFLVSVLLFLGVVWPEAVTLRILAAGPAGFIYPGLFCTTSLGCLAFSLGRGSVPCADRLLRFFEDYGVARLLVGLPGALGCAFLHVYRADVPEYEGATSAFATAFRAMAPCLFIGTAVCLSAAFDLARGRWVDLAAAYFPAVMLLLCVMIIVSWSTDAQTQQQHPAFQVWAILSCFLSTLGCLCTYFQCVERHNGERCSVASKKCLACLVAVLANAALVVAYLSSPTDEMPRAFEITGANEWQAGNSSTVNGVYHLRVDLRDGTPACCH